MAVPVNIAAVVNPHSAGGRTGRRWPQLHHQLQARLGPVAARFTERMGHATQITRDLLKDGFETIVAVGGDGTFNEVANGFLKDGQPLRPEAAMGMLPQGTGGDFRRSLGMTGGLRQALETLAMPRCVTIDIGHLRYSSEQGQIAERYFINMVSFGMGGAVAKGARNAFGMLGGRAAFFWSTALELMRYRGKLVSLELDGAEHAGPFRVINVAVGNGRFHGGGMHPCPTARMNDGELEVTVIEYMPRLRLLREIPVLYSDNVYSHPKTRHLRAHTLKATGDDATLIEVDGEPLGRLPIEIVILPHRLNVLAPSGINLPGID